MPPKNLLPRPIMIGDAAFFSFLAPIRDRLGCVPSVEVVEADGITMLTYLLPFTVKGKPIAEILKPFAKRLKSHHVIQPAVWNGRPCDLILPKNADVIIAGLEEEYKKDVQRSKAQSAMSSYRPRLDLMARALNKRVEMNLKVKDRFPPYDPADGTVHLLCACNPPGEFVCEFIMTVFGVPIDVKSQWVSVRRPTRGRGVVIRDPSGEPVAQILGTTVYLLIPIVGFFYPEGSRKIFDEMMTLVANELLDQHRGKSGVCKEHSVSTAKKLVAGMSDSAFAAWNGQLKETDDEIDHLRNQLMQKYRTRQDLIGVLKSFDQMVLPQAAARIRTDLRRIKKLASVERVYVCDGGVHVDTRPLHVLHEGQTYNLGTFTVRAGMHGFMSVWGRSPTHPEGVPHPHLPKDGTPCFGSATEAIIRAGAELRFGDAFELVLRWLSDGYQAHLADHPITEWPLVSANGGDACTN